MAARGGGAPQPTAAWIWAALLGGGLVVAGLLAALIAATVVILPYDEAFLGLRGTDLEHINPRLLPFMMHDRIAYAGAMVSIGVLYIQLALHGLRRGRRWAWRTLVCSAGAGFASFFLFLGHGYFDPLHALAALLLLPPFLLTVRAPPADRADTGWSTAQRLRDLQRRPALLCLVLVAVGLGGAGATIACLGATRVFVADDLVYLRTSAEELRTINERLLPLIAHDRAGFGGAVVSNALGLLLLTLWGSQRGARWVWWTIAGAGLPGFVAAIAVHFSVGYGDVSHLAPGFAGLLLFSAGLAGSYRFFCEPGPGRHSQVRARSGRVQHPDAPLRCGWLRQAWHRSPKRET